MDIKKVVARIIEKKDELLLGLVDQCYSAMDKVNRRGYYKTDYRRAEYSIKYLAYLVRAAGALKLSSQALDDFITLDDRGWIDTLVNNASYGLFSDKEKRRYQRKLKKLELDSLTRENLIALNLTDDLVLVMGILEELGAMCESYIHNVVVMGLPPAGSYERNVFERRLRNLGDCPEAKQYKKSQQLYRDATNSLISVYRDAKDKLSVIKDELLELAYGDIRNMEGSDERREEVFTEIKKFFTGVPFGALRLSKNAWYRRLLAPVHRLGCDPFYERIMNTYYDGVSSLPKFIAVLKDAEVAYYNSLATIKGLTS